MMQTFLDGQNLPNAGSTLASALAAASREAGDRLVVEAHADGEPVPQQHLAQPPDRDPYADELRITTAEPAPLVSSTLADAALLADDLRTRQAEAARALQTGALENALDNLSSILASWQALGQALQMSMQLPQVQVPDQVEGVGPITEITANLANSLNELKDALAAQDVASAADLLAYELDEQADRWSTLLRTLSQHIAGKPSS